MIKSLDSLLNTEPPAKELPTEFEDVAQEYLEQHSPIDSHESSKLQEELIKVHKHFQLSNINLQGSNNSDNAPKYILEKQLLFLAALSEICPCIISQEHIKHWLSLYGPIAIDSAGHKNSLVKSSRDLLLAILTCGLDSNNDASGNESRVKEAYAANSHMVATWILDWHLTSRAYSGNKEGIQKPQGEQKNIAKFEERRRFARANAKTVLFRYGTKRPKEFFNLLSSRFSQKKFRAEILTLLSAYVVSQPPSLFQIQYTPLLQQLYTCLERDLSSTVLSIGATVLAMILPHICDIIVPELARLFRIYGRLASWQYVAIEDDVDAEPLQVEKTTDTSQNAQWEVMNHVYEVNDSRVPVICPLFTFLYGLFPSNTIEFLRNPTVYIREAQNGGEDVIPDLWDKGVIQLQSKAIMGLHTLNPEIISLSAKEELEDSTRWHHMGSSTDIASRCLSLFNYASTSTAPSQESHDFGILMRDLELELGADNETPASPEPANDPNQAATNLDTLLSEHAQLYNRRSKENEDVVEASLSPLATPTSMGKETENTVAESVNRSPIFTSSMTGSVTSLNALQGLSSPRLEASSNNTPIIKPQTPTKSGSSTSQQDQQVEWLHMTIAFYQRELLLLKNELDFVSFIEQQSQYRFKKLKEQLSETAIAHAKVDELLEHNRMLKAKLEAPEKEQAKFQNSFRTYKSERRAYEGMLVAKNKEFRSQVAQMKLELEELHGSVDELVAGRKTLEDAVHQKEILISKLELRIADYERQIKRTAGYEKTVKELKHQLAKMKPKVNGQVTPQSRLDKCKLEEKEMELNYKALAREKDDMESRLTERIKQLQDTIRELSDRAEMGGANGDNDDGDTSQLITKQRASTTNKMIEDFKHSVEERYQRLERAYNQLEEKYQDSLKRYRDHLVSEEERRARIDQPVVPKRSLLGYEIMAASGDDEDSNGALHLNAKAENRVRGRGGVQNLARRAK